MDNQSLEQLLQTTGNPVKLARNSRVGPFVHSPLPGEYTNWRDEQRSWRKTCALFDLSYHMTDLYVEGPDVLRLFSALGINSFSNFEEGTAKQFVACNDEGYVIGDAILFFLEANKVSLVGRPSAHNWVQYHAQRDKYDVTLERDERSAVNVTGRRKVYRYQLQGPAALEVLSRATGKPLPEIKFFKIGELTIAGRAVRALRHGMSGAAGMELFGPWDEAEEIKGTLVEAGRELGLRQVGSKAYVTTSLESGWIASPLPAIFTGETMRPYREYLPANGYEGSGSLGGSFYSEDITDYYLTPQDLGYWSFVKFDHEFVGRDALQAMAEKPKRRKVTLVWNGADVSRAIGTLFDKVGSPTVQYIDLPSPLYSTWPYDKVLQNGRFVGLSTYSAYSYNERSLLSLGVVDLDVQSGTEVTVVWGEDDRESSRPPDERFVQREIRAVVGPCPYSEVARNTYAEGWRTRGEGV